MSKRQMIIAGSAFAVAVIAVVLWFILKPGLENKIVIPYIAHQKPMVDPHIPSSNSLADKLDEVQFDGLFNVSANPSGIIYEDGLGTLLGIDDKNVVSIKLNTDKKWQSSFTAKVEDDEVTITESQPVYFSAEDLKFTLDRIKSLGSLSPDFVLVFQAVASMDFDGPDQNGVIRFKFRDDRIWTEPDIKEVLSFKILPKNSDMAAPNYTIGTSAYMSLPPKEGVSNYHKVPGGVAFIDNVILSPYIDNSTYTTELRNNNINVLLEAPFGSLSPVLNDRDDFFYKSNLSTTFFAILFNTKKLNSAQRNEVKKLIDGKTVLDRFFKVGTEQQRNTVDYLGNKNNYDKYLNNSIFPSTSYYIEEQIVIPGMDNPAVDLSILPDTVRIKACSNFGYREEYLELIDILNDPAVTNNRIRVTAVSNDEIKNGNYDALLVAFTGYRSNFLFDLYDIFMRQPDLETYKINITTDLASDGKRKINPRTWQGNNNFFRLDAISPPENKDDINQLLEYIYGFMSTKEIGDKQAYAERIDRLENQLSLGKWLFSLPSLNYFSTQFDSSSIDLYGVASQLSTIEKWKESKD